MAIKALPGDWYVADTAEEAEQHAAKLAAEVRSDWDVAVEKFDAKDCTILGKRQHTPARVRVSARGGFARDGSRRGGVATYVANVFIGGAPVLL